MTSAIYLDYNATTPVLPEVMESMRPFLEQTFGNPSSIHGFGRAARSAIDEARVQIAQLVGAKEKEIIFTSGGTESNNLGIFGAIRFWQKREDRPLHVITCVTEHHAVLHPFEQLEKEGLKVTYLPVHSEGRLSVPDLEKAIRSNTILISIMSANNETGVLHPVSEIGVLCRKQEILFHCDAIQSLGKQRINVDEWNVDLLSATAHKFYGPKGIGFLYVRTGAGIQGIQLGGFHENERRAGTENVAGIVGMAKAASIAHEKAEKENKRLFDLTEKLWSGILQAIPGAVRNGDPINRLGNTLSVSFANCDGEGLIMGLDLEGVAVSSGSACMVGSLQPSHVLKAMGVSNPLAKATVRFSLGKDSNEEKIVETVQRLKRVISRLRKN